MICSRNRLTASIVGVVGPAGLLLAMAVAPATTVFAQEQITPGQAKDHIGEETTVCGLVVSGDYVPDLAGEPTFLVFGKPYPDQVFSVIIMGSDRGKFAEPPEELYLDTDVCVSGEVFMAGDKPQIAVTDPEAITLVEEESADLTGLLSTVRGR